MLPEKVRKPFAFRNFQGVLQNYEGLQNARIRTILTHFSPMLHFCSPENVRKPLVLRGYRNGKLG